MATFGCWSIMQVIGELVAIKCQLFKLYTSRLECLERSECFVRDSQRSHNLFACLDFDITSFSPILPGTKLRPQLDVVRLSLFVTSIAFIVASHDSPRQPSHLHSPEILKARWS